MCSVCRSTPCLSACPFAPVPRTYGKCKECGYDIEEGEEFVEILGEKYHYDCLSTMDILELLEIPVSTAGDDW